MDMKRFVEWQDRVMDDALKNDSLGKGCAKAFGVGALEGVIWGCAVVGALFTVNGVIDIVKNR